MAGQFKISPCNPLFFSEIITIDPRYNTLPLELQDALCYFQKFQLNDITTIQFLSDFTPTFKVYNKNGFLYSTESCVPVATTIIGQTFTCYEVTLNFAGFVVGDYYAQITYTDSNSVSHTWQCRPFSLAVKWKKTLLYEYTNGVNDFDMLFNTGIIFNIRVEGSLIFSPSFNASIYTDQNYNATKNNGVPYQTFKLYLGNSPGIPDWLANVFNFILQCDTISIDGTYYQNIEGSKWEIDRSIPAEAGAPTMAGYSIEVMPVDNALVERLQTGNITLNGYTPYWDTVKLFNLAADFTVSSLNQWFSVEKIYVFNTSGVPFTPKFGNTSGASDIATTSSPITGVRVFTVPSTYQTNGNSLYISGITGVTGLSVTIFIAYMRLAAIPVNSPNNPPAPQIILKGMKFMYEEVNSGDFANDFDVTTGLGKSTGNYPNAALCDGRNGTTPMGGKFTVGHLSGDITFGTPNAVVGANHINMTDASQLPNFRLNMFTSEVQTAQNVVPGATDRVARARAAGGDSLNYEISKGFGADATLGQTSAIGSSADINFLPLSVVTIFCKYLS